MNAPAPTPHDAVHLHVESPSGRDTIRVTPDLLQSRLTEVLRRQGLPLNARCGQRGLCDGCLVELLEGSLPRATGEGAFAATNGDSVKVRACECRAGDASIRIPRRSLLGHEPLVISEFSLGVSYAHDPLLAGPSVNDDTPSLGAAVDVGTTTVALVLVDLDSGRIVGKAAAFNRQMHLGDDVLTRINLCSTDPAMLGDLQRALVSQTLAPLLSEALRQSDMSESQRNSARIEGLIVAGNTTMLHLLAGVDPSSIGIAPFTPTFLDHRVLSAGDVSLRWPVHDDPLGDRLAETRIHLLPGAAGYVGADLVAGAVSSGLIYDPGPSLLVDVGTNGEIILKHGETFLGCATAAGPAFEGAGLLCGIRAGKGAIHRVRMEDQPLRIHAEVIGGDRPIGLCGSAYIDLLAEGRRLDLISASGRFQPASVDDAQQLLAPHEPHGLALRVGSASGGQDVLLAETDIANLLQAKAAIAAGVLTLLDHAGLTPAQVRHVYLAGGFGTRLNHAHAIATGLLPGFAPTQIRVVGNSSLAGALLALLDRSALDEMTRLAQRIRVVELNLVPTFEDRFIEQLQLP